MGFLAFAWWVPVAFFAVAGHLTNAATTIYLHRTVTHRGVTLHPAIAVAMRLWLWLTTGIVTQEWVACHRKHHAFADREGDPHSPVLAGLSQIVFNGWAHYRRGVREAGLLEKYGKGCPEDWIERSLFTRWSYLGVFLLLALEIYAFGIIWGPAVWLGQIVWMPFLGGLVNGVGHAWGYRNYDVKDESRNFFPFGLLLGGEELHNNHHADPHSARFRRRWWELDVGWLYIKGLAAVRLAKVVHAGRWQPPEAAEAA